MNNDHEPRDDAGEDSPADAPKPRDTPRDTPRDAGGVSSDAGWREMLSGLGVDVEREGLWQPLSGREAEGKPHKPGKPKREGKGRGKGKASADRGPSEASESGAQEQRRRGEAGGEMEERAQWVGESEVSIERLYELFDGAYMECDLDEDGDLRIVTDSGPRIFLSLHEPNRLIRYMAFYKFREETIEYDKLVFVNALNDDIVFIRFSLNGVDTLIADYYLPYSRGASPFHIINSAKLMGRVITSGIRQHDTNNLLE